ncbi:MAG: hypothetical protein K2W88_19840 [Pararheinheimera sp.]|nr:hypothetical protein [Rheinheimera sp.]
MQFSFNQDALQNLLDSRGRFSQARGERFDSQAFISRSTRHFDFSIPVDEAKLPKSAGIYLIATPDISSAYVGLASNIQHRFHNKQYGHLIASPETCRAFDVLAKGAAKIFVLEIINYEGQGIAQAEIDYYFLISSFGIKLTNAEWTLGKKGLEGRPVVSANVKTGEHYLFASVTEATATLFGLSQNPGVVACCLPSGKTGYQDQCNGFTHRYATKDEVEKGKVIIFFEDERLCKLAERIKEKYERGPVSGYVGVTIYRKTGLWQVTLNSGRWPTGRVKKYRFTQEFQDAETGAIAREDYIIKNALQNLNRSNFGKW